MDDYLDSCMSIEEASKRVQEAITISKNANWNMHRWSSNCASILKNVNKIENHNDLIKIDNLNNSEKVLGMRWLNFTDELTFNMNDKNLTHDILEGSQKPTNRGFLGIIMSIFDPLGFLAPFTIQSRILMQEIWQSKIDWDETLLEPEFTRWKQWLRELESVKSFRLERCYQLTDFQMKTAELHVFCDASSKAYAAVAYWRFSLFDGSFHTALITSKSRVAPLKIMSIPRLELQAALLGTRLAKMIISEHKFQITRRVFWSDSKTVLHWIKKDPRDFKIFVANRLDEIRNNSLVFEWKWVSTKENPADDGTRFTPGALSRSSRWCLGPKFLRSNETLWPS